MAGGCGTDGRAAGCYSGAHWPLVATRLRMDCSSPLRLKSLSIFSVIGSPSGVVVTGVKSDDVGDGAGFVPGRAPGRARCS